MTDIRSYILPTLAAVSMHAVLVVLASSAWFDQEPSPRIQPFQHVKAELVDLKDLTLEKQKQADLKKKQDADRRKAEAQRKAREKKKRLAEERKRKADQQKKAAAKKAAEKKKREQLAKAKAEKKRIADAKRKAEVQKKAAAKKAAEKKKREQLAKAEAEKKRKAEARRKAAAEKKRREAEALKRQQELARRQREEALARAAALEEHQRMQAEQDRTARASAISIITSAVSSNWRRPPSARNGMVVQVRIRLLPTGEVDGAYTVKSSGDEAFDRSAVNAVLKAERFPELQDIDPVVFDRNLRDITLNFRPEDLRL